MSTLFLILQGAMFGVVAGWAFPGWTWEFFALVIANAVFIVAYGVAED